MCSAVSKIQDHLSTRCEMCFVCLKERLLLKINSLKWDPKIAAILTLV